MRKKKKLNIGFLPVMAASPHMFSGIQIMTRGMSQAAINIQPVTATRIGVGGLVVGNVVGQSARVMSGLFNLGVQSSYKKFVHKKRLKRRKSKQVRGMKQY